MTASTNTNKPTKRQLQIERRDLEETLRRGERHEQLIADGYLLVRNTEREQFLTHSDELVQRIDALARYLGFGNYEPNSSHLGRRKRARRLWAAAFLNYIAMNRDADWWRANARNQYSIMFPPDAPPLPQISVLPAYVKGGSVLPHEDF